ncbi:MAG: DUF1361 domain-containing protein [Bacteroidota bacterium]
MNKIITIYILNRKQDTAVWLASLVAITLLLLRVKITHSMYLLFLIWNLFLAIIPYFLSSSILNNFFEKSKKIQNSIYAFIWLIFIPNTFYILTDFTHLHFKNTFQFGLDMLILSSFSFAGFYVGLLSLHHMHQLTIAKYGDKKGNLFILIISFLSAFGIYLGRVLRFNSWDIVSKPMQLAYKSISALFSFETIIYTMQLGIIILISYIIFYKWKENTSKNQ